MIYTCEYSRIFFAEGGVVFRRGQSGWSVLPLGLSVRAGSGKSVMLAGSGRPCRRSGDHSMSALPNHDRGPSVRVRPMSVYIGAEIEGADLTRPLPPDTVAEIRAALLEWKVIFFRGQFLDHPAARRLRPPLRQSDPGARGVRG